MNKLLLNTDIQEFISSNLNSNINSILLKGIPFSGVEPKAVVEQIEAKKRSEKKLPSWFNTQNLYYPNKLNIEQTSSELTAKYKANLISGDTIIDITGGFGVDCYYFSKAFKSVTHCEINTDLSEIVTHNYKQLNIHNITTIPDDGLAYLSKINTEFDWIYIDPSRRHDSKGKVFFLKDCLPNVPEHLDLLLKKAKNILIKTSPLLDISVGINELTQVKTIHVVAVNNEVKELLWVLEADYAGKIELKTSNLKNDTKEIFNFYLDDEKQLNIPYSLPLTYLFEPNAAVLKAGAFNSVANQLNVFKLHKNSHLYTSDACIEFPGRRFKIEEILNYNKSALKKLSLTKANITTRNFPESVETIRKKFKIQDGGDSYLFFTTDLNGDRMVLVVSKWL